MSAAEIADTIVAFFGDDAYWGGYYAMRDGWKHRTPNDLDMAAAHVLPEAEWPAILDRLAARYRVGLRDGLPFDAPEDGGS